jgi:hypothetical protein
MTAHQTHGAMTLADSMWRIMLAATGTCICHPCMVSHVQHTCASSAGGNIPWCSILHSSCRAAFTTNWLSSSSLPMAAWQSTAQHGTAQQNTTQSSCTHGRRHASTFHDLHMLRDMHDLHVIRVARDSALALSCAPSAAACCAEALLTLCQQDVPVVERHAALLHKLCPGLQHTLAHVRSLQGSEAHSTTAVLVDKLVPLVDVSRHGSMGVVGNVLQ